MLENNLRIYLSGAREETEYRDYSLKKYSEKLDIFEPIVHAENKILPKDFNWEDYINNKIDISDDLIDTIVLTDKSEVRKSDIVVAYITKYSAGTIMEIEHAHDYNIPVFIIDVSKKFRKDIWIKYHSTKFFNSIDECFEYILLLNKK